jgi:hypothetical protein
MLPSYESELLNLTKCLKPSSILTSHPLRNFTHEASASILPSFLHDVLAIIVMQHVSSSNSTFQPSI